MRQMRNRTMKSADLATLRSLHGRKRWEHIWAYYKLPIIGILIVLYIFGYAAYRHFTKKEAVLYVSLVNISAGSDLTGQLTDGFAQYAHLTKKQQVNLLTGLTNLVDFDVNIDKNEDPLDLSQLTSLTNLSTNDSPVANLPANLVKCNVKLKGDFDFSALTNLTSLRVTFKSPARAVFPNTA